MARAPDADKCMQPLGMEHGHIGDDKITASSAFDHKSVGPQNGRGDGQAKKNVNARG